MLMAFLDQVNARLGEIHFLSSFSPGDANETSIERALTEAIRRYCRSIELCDGYLRGYYGLKIVSILAVLAMELVVTICSPPIVS